MSLVVENKDVITWEGLLLALRDQGIHYIRIYFSGAGDSGDIDEVEFLPPEFVEDNGEDGIERSDAYYQDGQGNNPWEKLTSFKQPDEVTQFIENRCYSDHLNSIGDWVNNDGGQGEMFIRTKDATYYTNAGYNYTSTDYESYQGQLAE